MSIVLHRVGSSLHFVYDLLSSLFQKYLYHGYIEFRKLNNCNNTYKYTFSKWCNTLYCSNIKTQYNYLKGTSFDNLCFLTLYTLCRVVYTSHKIWNKVYKTTKYKFWMSQGCTETSPGWLQNMKVASHHVVTIVMVKKNRGRQVTGPPPPIWGILVMNLQLTYFDMLAARKYHPLVDLIRYTDNIMFLAQVGNDL